MASPAGLSGTDCCYIGSLRVLTGGSGILAQAGGVKEWKRELLPAKVSAGVCGPNGDEKRHPYQRCGEFFIRAGSSCRLPGRKKGTMPPERDELTLLTPREAAVLLTVPETPVREWLKRHRVPRVPSGKRLRIQRRVVNDLRSGRLKVGQRGEWKGRRYPPEGRGQ